MPTKCRAEECGEAGVIAGWCPGHAIIRYRKDVMRNPRSSFKRTETPLPTCVGPMCRREGVYDGLCSNHLAQRRRRGQLRPLPQVRPMGAALLRDDVGRKQCGVCLDWRPEASYARSPVQRDGLQPTCQPCRVLAQHGLSPEAHAKMLESQGGVCAICERPDRTGRALSVDHSHACCPGSRSCGKCVRGLLCNRCNLTIGRFSDDSGRMEAAAAYVEEWRLKPPRELPAAPKGRRDNRWYAFKVTPDGYARMLATQGGTCALCDKPPGVRALAVDHDHKCCARTGSAGVTCGRCVRGLLCMNCNVGIGTFDDDPEVIRRAAAYLNGAVTSTFLAQ